MTLAPITDAQLNYIKNDINMDDAQLENKIKQVKEWMKKQPHLPQIPDDVAEKMISMFLIGTKMSTEITKHKLDSCYAMRHQLPEIFDNRDPTQQDIRDSVDRIRYFVLPELTPDCVRVSVLSYNPDKNKKFTAKDLVAFYKRLTAIGAARMRMGDVNGGEYFIVDSKGFYKSHITELPWSLMQKFTSLAQEAFPTREKGIFIINSPAYADTVLNLLKPVMKEKVRNRIHVFQRDHKNLYKFIPQEMLPSDFGGNGPSVEESSRAWQQTIESMRDFLIEDNQRKTDESKRPADCPNLCGQMFGVNGTFNKLNID